VPPGAGPVFIRGDANADGSPDVTDAVFLLTHMYPTPNFVCMRAADCNYDNSVDISDASFLLMHLFPNPSLPDPNISCGQDTGSSLSCVSFPPCGWPVNVKGSSERAESDVKLILGAAESRGDEVVIPIYLESGEDFAGIQVEMSYAGGYSVAVSTEGCASEEFDYFLDYTEGGKVDFVGVVSLVPGEGRVQGLEAGRYKIAEIRVVGKEVPEFRVDKVVVSSRDGHSLGPVKVLSVEEAQRKPRSFALFQNVPNPFSGNTVIKYALPKDVDVELTVYNVAGQRVRTLVNGRQRAGYKAIEWDGRDDAGRRVAPGVYFYRMKAGRFEATRKLTLLR